MRRLWKWIDVVWIAGLVLGLGAAFLRDQVVGLQCQCVQLSGGLFVMECWESPDEIWKYLAFAVAMLFGALGCVRYYVWLWRMYFRAPASDA